MWNGLLYEGFGEAWGPSIVWVSVQKSRQPWPDAGVLRGLNLSAPGTRMSYCASLFHGAKPAKVPRRQKILPLT